MKDLETELLEKKVFNDLIIIGYMMFLDDNKLLEKASEYVHGFLECVTKEEWQEMVDKEKETLEQAREEKKNAQA